MNAQASLTWDLAVLGGGSAGIVAAKTAAQLGARVVLIEAERTGGDCLWTGCVPSKALLAAAGAAADARNAGRFGIHVTGTTVNFTEVMDHVRRSIRRIEPVDSIQALSTEGISVITGRGTFLPSGALDVEGRVVQYCQALLATGASPAIPPIPGLETMPVLTSDTLWDLDVLPERLAILGGGSIGCELGQAFARLGSQVTIIEAAGRILPREDPRAAAAVQRSLVRDGARILPNTTVARVQGSPDGSGSLMLESPGGGTHQVEFDRLLVAVGRTPNTSGLGLDVAGVRRDERGYVLVDRALQTSNRRIWAAGDLTGYPQFTHTAGVHGSLAASNAVLGLRRKVDIIAIPRVTFTDPEVASVGAATWGHTADARISLPTREHVLVDRAVTHDDTDGFACLAIDPRGRIAGAALVGPRAGESLGELTLAVRLGLSARDIAGTMHPYPTYADGAWNAAIDSTKAQLARPWTRRTLTALLKLRRARLR
ncbi:MAG: FAD-dependent oxidoreductase [Candidatus Nanopelagicales bacterium]|nr:FAD-dependent oxidoreductase [Candidatus Nanopelagicales bacterium]